MSVRSNEVKKLINEIEGRVVDFANEVIANARWSKNSLNGIKRHTLSVWAMEDAVTVVRLRKTKGGME